MKTLFRCLPSALALAVFASAHLCAQTSSTGTASSTPKAVHRPSAAGAASTATNLPPNIPVVHGILKTEFALKYIDIKPGIGPLAQPDWKYSVHYTGWLHDGTKFDSSVDRGTPIEFIQGAHRVIPGWDDGFDGMRVGGKRRLFIPWQLAYGEAGRGKIPPKADLIFDIELVAQSDPNAPPPPPPPQAPANRPTTQAAPAAKSATPQ